MAATTSATPSLSLGPWAVAPRSRLVDFVLFIVVCVPVVASPFSNRRGAGLDVVIGLMAFSFVVARRRWPIPVLGAGLVTAVAVTATVQRPTAAMTVIVVLLFNVAVRYDRPTAIRAGVAGLVALLACIAILVSNDFLGPELLAGLAWPTLAVAAGDAVRSRREAIAAAEERAVRAEATREEEARRRVVEERLHIARELHDVVAHQIAVINVQAGVAAHLLQSRPDDAAAALATVRSSARTVLDELAGILGVLRAPDDDGSATDPTPSLADLPALVASFERIGLHVTLETAGEDPTLADSVGIAVYRTVQEALTNAHKYGDGQAVLRVAHDGDRLELTVTNRISGSAAVGSASGFGLVGMRERVRHAGGDVTAEGRPDGTFVVRAHLPVLARAEQP